jgi:hypothetical protein
MICVGDMYIPPPHRQGNCIEWGWKCSEEGGGARNGTKPAMEVLQKNTSTTKPRASKDDTPGKCRNDNDFEKSGERESSYKGHAFCKSRGRRIEIKEGESGEVRGDKESGICEIRKPYLVHWFEGRKRGGYDQYRPSVVSCSSELCMCLHTSDLDLVVRCV